jgi:hypothetical protein
MPRTCINHKETPSVTMCHQCHNPICKSCSLVMPQGIFCSPECGILNREFKEKLKEGKPKEAGGFFTKGAAAFVLMVVGFMGIHIAATHGMSPLKRIDVIGMILNVAAGQKGGAQK